MDGLQTVSSDGGAERSIWHAGDFPSACVAWGNCTSCTKTLIAGQVFSRSRASAQLFEATNIYSRPDFPGRQDERYQAPIGDAEFWGDCLENEEGLADF